MKVTAKPTKLAGLLLIEFDFFRDERGFFIESYNRRDFAAVGIDANFVQDNHSKSGARVIRGLHFQDTTAPVGKLVRCTAGAILDVAVDIRATSPTFGQWVGVRLDTENKHALWVPPGFAHGFAVLGDSAEVQYKVTTHYTPDAEHIIRWNDPNLAIDWPFDNPLLSRKDAAAPGWQAYCDKPIFT